MRVLFVARAIDRVAGGVERMIVTIMNALAARGHEIALFTWDGTGAESFYPMRAEVVWYRLDRGSAAIKASLGERLHRMSAVRRIVSKAAPEAIVCFQGGPFLAMRAYTLGMGIPIIAAERTAPTLFEHAGTNQHRTIEHLAFMTAARVTVQIERYREMYPPYLRGRITSIPNPVEPATQLAQPGGPGPDGRFRLLSVGRLSYQKNYPALLAAFARVAPQFSQWDLDLVGDGEDRSDLEASVAAAPALAGRVRFRGAQRDVAAWYRNANVFCLPSRWEGFPNALAEALTHGVPSVGFRGCAGVPDLIADGQTGWLAAGNGDPGTLAAALSTAMASSDRTAIGAAAAASMRPYAPSVIFDAWERLLDETMRR